jgi:hypothetical protein
MRKKLNEFIVHRMMSRAAEISGSCGDACREFKIMVSEKRPDTLILQWTSINIDNLDAPMQSYHYECFDQAGHSQNCSVNYKDQADANDFFRSLKALHHQTYSTDHER